MIKLLFAIVEFVLEWLRVTGEFLTAKICCSSENRRLLGNFTVPRMLPDVEAPVAAISRRFLSDIVLIEVSYHF